MNLTSGDKVFHQKAEEVRKQEKPSVLLMQRAPQGIAGRKGKLGILPSSFNPPTLAHLALVREAKKQVGLDEVLVLLDIRPMDKRVVEASLEHRLTMLKLLFQRDPKISIGVSNRGLFVDKVAALRTLYPSPVSLTFVVGFDTLVRVLDKKYYRNRRTSLDTLFEGCHFLVANRGEECLEAVQTLLRKPENLRYRKKVLGLNLPCKYSFHSSSLVREKIERGERVDPFVSPRILRFIEEAGLYRHRFP